LVEQSDTTVKPRELPENPPFTNNLYLLIYLKVQACPKLKTYHLILKYIGVEMLIIAV